MLSPETVRTHVRNAMAKLGASTRSQAVALALQQRQITSEAAEQPTPAGRQAAGAGAGAGAARGCRRAGLERMLEGLVRLYDVDGGGDLPRRRGRALAAARRSRPRARPPTMLPAHVALGDGALGRAALERRAQLLQGRGGAGARTP